MGKMYDEAMGRVSERMDERKKYLKYEEASIRYGFGETKLRQMAKECGALRTIGKSTRINKEVFDRYMETFQY